MNKQVVYLPKTNELFICSFGSGGTFVHFEGGRKFTTSIFMFIRLVKDNDVSLVGDYE